MSVPCHGLRRAVVAKEVLGPLYYVPDVCDSMVSIVVRILLSANEVNRSEYRDLVCIYTDRLLICIFHK
jgi:hypothetical protein